MKLTTETHIADFEFWAGAKDNVALLTYRELDELESHLEELYPEGIDETQLNDLMWFDFEMVCEWLGLDFDEVNECED